MADFEEVIRFLADPKDVNNVLRQLERDVPKSMKRIKDSAGQVLKEFGVKEFDTLLKKVRDLNSLVQTQTRLYKELNSARKVSASLRGDITPQFDTRTGGRGSLESPSIRAPLNKMVAEDFKIVEQKEQESFERRLRNRLNYQNKQRDLARKLRVQSAKEAERTTQKRIAEERKKQERLFKEQQRGIRKRIAAMRAAAQQEVKTAQKAANEVALARRSRASRNLRIGAGLAGAAGNFRVASGLFTASTAIQGLPLDDFRKGGSLIGSIGKQAAAATPLVLGFGAAFAAIGAAVFELREGLRLEKEIAKLSTLFTDAALSGVSLQDALKETQLLAVELATTFNIELTDAVEGFETALSAGIDFPDLAEFSREATELSQALKVSFSESVDILTTLKDSYKLSIGDLTKVNNILFRTIDEGKITVSDLSTNLGRVASVASTAGVEIEDLFGLLAFATRQGLKSSRAITSVAKFIESVVDPTDKAKKKFRELGIEFGQAALKGDRLAQFIGELSSKTGGQLDVLSQLFPQDRALRIAASLSKSSEAAQEFISFVNEAGEETGDAAKAANRALDSTAVRFERFVKAIRGQTAVEGINLIELIVPDVENFQASLESIRLDVAGFFKGFNSLFATGGLVVDSFKLVADPKSFFRGDFLEGVEEAKDDIRFLNEQYAKTAISIAKAAVAQGRFDDAIAILVKGDVYDSVAEARKEVEKMSKALALDKNVAAIESVADVIKSELTESLDTAVNAASQFSAQLSKLREEADSIRRKEGESGLLPVEKKQLQNLDLELEKLFNTTDQRIASLGLKVTQAVTDRVSGLQKVLVQSFEDAPGGVSTKGVETFVEQLRGLVGDTDDIKNIENKLVEIANERAGGSANEAIKKRVEELIKLVQNFDFGDVAADLFSRDSFDAGKILELFPDDGRRKFAEIYLKDIQSGLDEIKELQQDSNDIIDTGLKRGEKGVELSKEQEKLLKKLNSEQEKITESKAAELDFTRLTSAEITRRLNELDKIERAGISQARGNIAAGNIDAAEKNFKFLEDLRETREALQKGLDNRASLEKGYVEEVIALRKKELEEARKFEEQRTEDLKKEVEKRKDITKEAQQVQRSLNEELFDRLLQGESSERKQRDLVEERFNKLLEDARKAAGSGDTEVAKELFGRARETGSALTDLDFNKRRREGVDTAREVFDQLSELNNTIRDADISASLDVTEQLNKGAAEFSTAVELLTKAMKEEGPLVSVDRSQNTYTITINNQRANDDVVNDALEEFKRKLAQGTEENTRNQTQQIKSVTPPQRSVNPTGGAFPQ